MHKTLSVYFYLFVRQDLLVTKFTGHIRFSAGVHHTSNIDESPLEKFGRSGSCATDGIRESY